MRRLLSLAALLLSACAFAQTDPPKPTPPNSHQVNADDTITFRLMAPGATQVLLSIDASSKLVPMTKDSTGLWSLTTPVLPPEYYNYQFVVDGIPILDPLSDDVIRNYVSRGSSVLVPGRPPEPWELSAVPHGRVDHHLYTTHVAKHLPLNQEPYVVYTPPGYDPHHKGGYPVLYLLHGWSDAETGWTANGRADKILDTLFSEGRAVPMIVVMPLGYGDLDFVTHGFQAWQDPSKVSENTDLYSKMLLTEIMPAVERQYDVAAGRENRAIVGLSMGGLESLTIGLNHPDTFAYVGGMSAAVFGGQASTFESDIPHADAKKADLRLLWIACGKADHLFTANQEFIAWTKTKGFDPVAVETPGAHTWLTWRANLLQLTPLLFRKN